MLENIIFDLDVPKSIPFDKKYIYSCRKSCKPTIFYPMALNNQPMRGKRG